MRVLPPLAITDAILTSSTVAESEAVWSSATTYAIGDQRRPTASGADTHRLFESLVASNLGHNPLTDFTNTYWTEIGVTNRWRMFDLLRNTGTVGASPMTVVLTPGRRIDSIAAVGMVADSITVSLASVSGSYTKTINLSTREVTNWYEYFFAPFSFQANVAIFDLPPWSDAVITITLTRSSGSVTLGGLLTGLAVLLGNTQFSPVSDVLNFSTVERDEFGTSLLVPRRTAPITSQVLWCDKAAVNKAIAVREQLNATPALWSGLDDSEDGYFEALLILGYYRQFKISLDYPDVAQITLELEEV